jgi:oleandomycin transport system ATP-binding protein
VRPARRALGELPQRHVTGSHRDHQLDRLADRGWIEVEAIQVVEHHHCRPRKTLVAINKRMVADDRFQQCRRLLVDGQVRVLAEGARLWPVRCRVEQADAFLLVSSRPTRIRIALSTETRWRCHSDAGNWTLSNERERETKVTISAIEAEGLVKTFGKVRALDGIDMVAPEGTVFGLLGPNGAGKTTAIRVLSTLLRPDAGRASVGGYDVVRQPKQVRRLIGLTGQYAAVDELLSGHENLYMIGRLLGLRAPQARARAAELLEAFDLADAASKLAKTYSGGMRRRLDLAASLVGRPRFLYLDEPTTGLDPKSRLALWGMIRGLVADGATVLLTTQYLEEADRLADEIVVIDRGRVIAAGTPEQLKTRVGGQVLQARPSDPADLAATERILAAFAAGEDGTYTDGQLVTVTIADRSALGQAVRRLDDAGIVVDDLALRRPSLDEVFLAVTGHLTEDEPQPDDDPQRSRT